MNTLVASPENETMDAGAADAAEDGLAAGALDPARFRIQRQIGQGGMATIHLAELTDEDGAACRQVALKLMHSHLNEDPGLVRRFEHEVRAQAGLRHPCVVEMLGWGRDPVGRLFMAMEYVDGPALKDLMAQGRRFPADMAVWVTRSILAGLEAAHARGLVHRDVKPANVMTTTDGLVKVADFGISKAADMTKLTSTGSVIGTPAYMSPEQALGRPIDGRSDLFSAGVALYEMLVGGNPFQTGNPATTLSRVVHHQQRPAFEMLPQVPPLLDELLESLLQKDATKRMGSAAEAIALLDRCIAEEDLCATPEAFAAFLREPDLATRRLNARRARRCFDAATRLYAGGKGNAEGAVWQFFLATLLDPSDPQPRTWLEQVSRERGYNLQRKPHPRIDELEAQLKDDPDNLPLLLQLAKLHKTQGNFLQVIFYYKRAKALRPPDNYTRNQIETLVSARAASVLDGTGVFETRDHVPVRVRPSPEAMRAAATAEHADGWGDFARGLLSTGWGKAALGAAAVTACVLVVGTMFDKVAVAAGRGGGVSAMEPEPELDRQVMALERGKELASKGRDGEAEKVWRGFLDAHPGSGLRSEVLFRLGDALERQGRRPEALEIHAQNAGDHLDEWALRSRMNRGEMLAVDGDTTASRAEYEAVAKIAEPAQKAVAVLALANLAVREGRHELARREFEDVLVLARGTELHDEARLDYADFLAADGDAARARTLYAEVRDHADHRGEAFQRASRGLELLPGGDPGAAAATADTPAAPADVATEPSPLVPAGAEASPQDAAPAAAAGDPGSGEPPATGLLTGLGAGR